MRTEFVGREEELAWLRGQFDECATRGPDGQYGGPRMAFVIAESGMSPSCVDGTFPHGTLALAAQQKS